MKKKRFLIIIILSVISVIFIVIMVYKNGKDDKSINITASPSSSLESSYQTEVPDGVSFTKSLTNLYEEYPWYSKLPIDTNYYHIVYDFSEEKFRIRLKKILEQNKIETVVRDANNDLKKIGVKEPYGYYVIDANGNRI